MKLLVSVRSAEEALVALEGGADVIDIKEPSRGSLGRADDATIAAVVHAIAGRRTVSAACGELLQGYAAPRHQPASYQLRFVKWGLAGCADQADWQERLVEAALQLPPSCQAVAVAYADWKQANAPSPEEVCAFSCEHDCGAFLIDTWRKDGSTLIDHTPLVWIESLLERCRAAQLPVALAGSLGGAQIKKLLPLAPDWFAVRGAACREGDRNAGIDVSRVHALVELISRTRFLSRA